MSTAATDNREQRDVVASNPDNNRVVDERGNPVPDVKPQETPPGVDDALRCAAECLERLDSLERLPEADDAARDDEVGLRVETRNGETGC